MQGACADSVDVPRGGLEPPRPRGQRILNPSRLPIPPPGQVQGFRKQNPPARFRVERCSIKRSSACSRAPVCGAAPHYGASRLASSG